MLNRFQFIYMLKSVRSYCTSCNNIYTIARMSIQFRQKGKIADRALDFNFIFHHLKSSFIALSWRLFVTTLILWQLKVWLLPCILNKDARACPQNANLSAYFVIPFHRTSTEGKDGILRIAGTCEIGIHAGPLALSNKVNSNSNNNNTTTTTTRTSKTTTTTTTTTIDNK